MQPDCQLRAFNVKVTASPRIAPPPRPHPPPSSTYCELRQTMWYYSGVISSLMRPDCQLRAFNAKMTASPRITPPPRPHSCLTVLVLLFGTTGMVVFEGVLLSSSVTLVGRGQDGPRRRLSAA